MEKKGRRSEPLVGNLKMKEDEEEKENRSQRKRRSTSDEQPSETPNKKKTPVKEAIRKMLAAKTENKINALAIDLQNLRASGTPSPPPVLFSRGDANGNDDNTGDGERGAEDGV